MSQDPQLQYQSPQQPASGPLALSIVSLVAGILSCPSAILPICGCPVGIAGIVCGSIAFAQCKKLPEPGAIKPMAIVGLSLSSLGMFITLANAAWGMYLGSQGKLFAP